MKSKLTSRWQKTEFLSAIIMFGLVLFIAVTSLGRTQTVIAQNSDQVLKDALVTGIAMGLPGISVVIGTGDTITWTGTAGYSDLQRRIPVKVNTRAPVVEQMTRKTAK